MPLSLSISTNGKFQAILILLFVVYNDKHLIGKKYARRVESKRNADDAYAVPRESVIRSELIMCLSIKRILGCASQYEASSRNLVSQYH